MFWLSIGITLLLSYVMFVIIEAPFSGLDYFVKPQNQPTPNGDWTQIRKK